MIEPIQHLRYSKISWTSQYIKYRINFCPLQTGHVMLRVLKERFTLQLHINFTFYGANSVPGYMLWPCPCVCPSVCLSVTSWCSTKTAKHRITQTTPTILQGVHWSGAKDIGKTTLASLSNAPHTNIIKEHAKLVGQCPTWWPPCRIQVALSAQRRKVWLTPAASAVQ